MPRKSSNEKKNTINNPVLKWVGNEDMKKYDRIVVFDERNERTEYLVYFPMKQTHLNLLSAINNDVTGVREIHFGDKYYDLTLKFIRVYGMFGSNRGSINSVR